MSQAIAGMMLLLVACRPPSGPPPGYERLEIGPRTPAEERASVTAALTEMLADEERLSDAHHRDPVCVHDHLTAVTTLYVEASAAQLRLERCVAAYDTAGAEAEVVAVAHLMSQLQTVMAEADRCAWVEPPALNAVSDPGRHESAAAGGKL